MASVEIRSQRNDNHHLDEQISRQPNAHCRRISACPLTVSQAPLPKLDWSQYTLVSDKSVDNDDGSWVVPKDGIIVVAIHSSFNDNEVTLNGVRISCNHSRKRSGASVIICTYDYSQFIVSKGDSLVWRGGHDAHDIGIFIYFIPWKR